MIIGLQNKLYVCSEAQFVKVFSSAHYHTPRISSETQTLQGGKPCRL